VVADSAQFSAALSELSDPRYVGTALTLQTGVGFLLTLITLRLVPAMSPSHCRKVHPALGEAVTVTRLLDR